jgi:hypothetical protein
LEVGYLEKYKIKSGESKIQYKIKILHIDGSILVMSMLPDPIMMRMEYLRKCSIFNP